MRDRLAPLELPPDVRARFDRRDVSLGLAWMLAATASPDRQRELARLVADRGLTLAPPEALVGRGRSLSTGGGGRDDRCDRPGRGARGRDEGPGQAPAKGSCTSKNEKRRKSASAV